MRNIQTLIALFVLIFVQSAGAESAWDQPVPATSEPLKITVYRSPTCSCCGFWLEHLKKHRFEVTDIQKDDMPAIKKEYGVPTKLGSCHTAIINGYVMEGHVPAAYIVELINKKPNVVGLTVPGMVMGSPGMDRGGSKQPFSVLSFDKEGKVETFKEYLFY